MSCQPLCPAPAAWRIETIAPERDRLILPLEPRGVPVACPVWATPSRRVHRRYRPTPWDVLWGRSQVPLVVRARRFFCQLSCCPRQIFTEPFPSVLARSARQNACLRQVLLALASASIAELAARVACWLGSRTSPDTRICRQRADTLVVALPLLEQAEQRGAVMGILGGESLRVGYVSEAYLLAGRIAEAIQLAGRALDLARAHKEGGHEAWALRLLGEIAAHQDPPESEPAAHHYRQARALAEELGMRPLQAHRHLGLGSLYSKLGQRQQACAELTTAIALYRDGDDVLVAPGGGCPGGDGRVIAERGDSLLNRMSPHGAGTARCESMNRAPERPVQLYVPLLGWTRMA